MYQENSFANPDINSELLSESFATHPGAATYLQDGRLTPPNEFEEPSSPNFEFAKQDRPDIYEDRCMVGKVTTKVKICEYGELMDYDYAIALVGGSHYAHWQPMLVELAKAHNMKIVTYLKSNCRFTEEVSSDHPECGDWFKSVKAKLTKDKPDLLFTVGTVGSQQEEFDEVSDGFIKAWQYFENQDIPLFLVRDTPWYKQHVLTCLSDNADEPEKCKAKQKEIVRDQNPLAEVDYISENATTMDLTDYFCDGEHCHYVVGNVVTHFDANHLTAAFSRSFAPVFEEPILEALEK